MWPNIFSIKPLRAQAGKIIQLWLKVYLTQFPISLSNIPQGFELKIEEYVHMMKTEYFNMECLVDVRRWVEDNFVLANERI